MLSYNVLNSWVEKMMKKSLPVKIKTSNITTLSTKDINKLKAGDIVLKKTGNQKHAYIVSYKEDNQGICLTYTDASVIETVSYDYNTTTKVWTYNSTDITQVQPKLTAGDNVQINNGVISATDTTYTAGENISITDGVISSIGGGEVWESYISLNISNAGYVGIHLYTKEQLTNDNYMSILINEMNQDKIIPAIPDIYNDLPTVDTDTKFLATGIFRSSVSNLTLRGFDIANDVLNPTLKSRIVYFGNSHILRYSHKIN